MKEVWRIGFCPTPAPKLSALLSSMDHGSTLAHGRWHVMGGRTVIYCGSSRAICQLEKRVHANGARPKNQALFRLVLPKVSKVLTAESLGLDPQWQADEAHTQKLGMDWLASDTSLALSVPSFVEPLERNILLNPKHPDFKGVTLVIERHPFKFDERLF